MKQGFTTGSCAAAAAKAATFMLLGGNRIDQIRIATPAGIDYCADVLDINIGENAVSCAVRKYSGDDPDITDGILVYARVELIEDTDIHIPDAEEGNGSGTKTQCGTNISKITDVQDHIVIEGGEGIGTITRPGLDQPVGSKAINSVPRAMITDEVTQVAKLFDHTGSLKVTIYVPGGKELAEKTFNPKLGIEGGISIIGTSGIVEPMSTRALLETIRLELNQRRLEGADTIVISPGNYGLSFMKEQYGYDLNKAVKCSNYIGDSIDMAVAAGYKHLLLTGHIGKLIKVSGGIMNTHSREADCRMELMAAAAARCGADPKTLLGILDSVSTEEAYGYLKAAGIEQACMSYIMKRILYHLNKRAEEKIDIRCIMYSVKWGLLGCSPGAEEMLV